MPQNDQQRGALKWAEGALKGAGGGLKGAGGPPPRARPYFNPCKDTYRLFNSSVSQWHVQSANFPNNFRRKSLRLLNSAHSRFKSMSSSNSWCASHTASAFRRFCVIVVHSHVFRRLSAEKLLSAAQLDTGQQSTVPLKQASFSSQLNNYCNLLFCIKDCWTNSRGTSRASSIILLRVFCWHAMML